MKVSFVILFFILSANVFAHENEDTIVDSLKNLPKIRSNGTRVFSQNIKTIRISIKDVNLSFPVIELNGNKQIEVSFDELTSESKTYSYKLIHCDADWNQSKIMSIEYMKGFENISITNWKASENTAIDYIHYWFSFPNENITLTKSGNYLIQVFDDNNASTPVFETRCVIIDRKISVNSSVKRSSYVESMDTKQEINIDLNLGDLNVRDPYQDIKVVICQNGRWDNAITGLQPAFINNNAITYPQDGSNLIDGGNEYRVFSTKTSKYITEHIKSIEFNGKTNRFILLNDEPRRYKNYEKTDDINGKFYILNEMSIDCDVSSDYEEVLFELQYPEPEPQGEIHLMGALVNWEINEDSKMQYDSISRSYRKTLLLKQGIYNYQYAYVDNQTKIIDCSYEENSHYETENDYYIFVYHRDILTNIDSVVGFSFITNKL